ncbi:MAG: NADH-quinone oxidoreductase subunit A [Candidatus Electryonea clarkiae]|nr:NADH-quinone oxidoreductase subunit A [Candidatus Electryonea clarkiae]MDP8288284.1 NADH-quinone oxidoreductase subunit A [Candidatus Electryonea clarkiae]
MTPNDFLPVLITFFVVGGFAGITLIATHILGPKRYSKEKHDIYECGLDYIGDSRKPFSVKFYLVAVLFVIFDLEVVFMYPWAVNFRHLGLFGFVSMGIFLVILTVGLLYEWKKGALEWE